MPAPSVEASQNGNCAGPLILGSGEGYRGLLTDDV